MNIHYVQEHLEIAHAHHKIHKSTCICVYTGSDLPAHTHTRTFILVYFLYGGLTYILTWWTPVSSDARLRWGLGGPPVWFVWQSPQRLGRSRHARPTLQEEVRDTSNAVPPHRLRLCRAQPVCRRALPRCEFPEQMWMRGCLLPCHCHLAMWVAGEPKFRIKMKVVFLHFPCSWLSVDTTCSTSANSSSRLAAGKATTSFSRRTPSLVHTVLVLLMWLLAVWTFPPLDKCFLYVCYLSCPETINSTASVGGFNHLVLFLCASLYQH